MAALLYHEPQIGALCGVHCLNALLQGPFFTEIDLAHIAQELDAAERQLLDPTDQQAGGSGSEPGNVDSSGMFSSQVLSQALGVWGLRITPITSPDMRGVADEPQKEAAFICNLEEHWFCIRRVGDAWYNFNSLLPAPEALGTFYLSAYLAALRQQGHTIFVVRGALPQPPGPGDDEANAHGGRWLSPDEAKQATAAAVAARAQGRVKASIEAALARADAAGGSLQLRSRRVQEFGGGGGGGGGSGAAPDGFEDDSADLAAAIMASLGQAAGSGQGATATGPDTAVVAEGAAADDSDDMDAGLAAAIAASLQHDSGGMSSRPVNEPLGVYPVHASREAEEQLQQPRKRSKEEPLAPEPEPGEGVLELAFRLPAGSRIQRRFHATDPTDHLFRFLSGPPASLDPGTWIRLSLQFPRKDVPRSTTGTLAEAGLADRSVLCVDVSNPSSR